MRRATNMTIDTTVMVLILAMTLPTFVNGWLTLAKGDFGGFNTQIEKTAMKTRGEIVPATRDINRDDIMLMLAISDMYCQEPKTLRINGNSMALDGGFFQNRTTYLMNAFTYMPTNSKMKFTLYVGSGGPRFWSIDSY